MHQLSLTLDSLAENLALDEALLDEAEAGEIEAPVLRIWESPTYGVVLGRSSQPEIEVNLDTCQAESIPVLRRSSGGGTILTGPGCLMYALVLDFHTYSQLQAIDQAHQYVLRQLALMLSTDTTRATRAGTSDLVLAADPTGPARKFSGNAARLKRKHLLYHGTLLYSFDLDRIPQLLATPTRTPDYRGERSHADFVANLPLNRAEITTALLHGWQAHQQLPSWPQQRTADLVTEKYTSNPKWVILP